MARDIAQQLVRIGHTVVGVTGRGEEAVTLASATRPSIVLMDIRLEDGIDGIEARGFASNAGSRWSSHRLRR